MRKFTILALLAFGLLAIPKANAQTPTIVDSDSYFLIPGTYSEDGKEYFCLYDYDDEKGESDGNTFYASIYDADFTLVRKIVVPTKRLSVGCVYFLNADGSESFRSSITRGIFSNEFNYIVPITEDNGSSSYFTKGFNVYDLDGNIITTISFPEGYYQNKYDNELVFFSLNGKRYIMADYCTGPNDSYEASRYAIVYRMDSMTRATQVAVLENISIAPRTPRKGENVTVSLNDAVQAEGCVVNVVASDGRTVLQTSVPAGENTFTFNTAGFPQGLYVVTTAGKQGIAEAAKIIVR